MFIELTHDIDGNIGSCYCSDSLPTKTGEPLICIKSLPAGKEHVRLIIDTLIAMEINQNSGIKAIINAQGNPEIVDIDRTTYIKDNFIVDMSQIIQKPNDIILSDKLTLRRLKRKV